MRLSNTGLLLLLTVGWPSAVGAQLQLLPDQESQQVFAGDARKISTVWHNAGDKTLDVEIRARLYQTSPTTAVALSEKPWKTIEILPGQTVLESAKIDFPDVRAGTDFLIQWLENSNHVLGTTAVLVYPTNLLAELKPLGEDQSLGVFDPQNQLKALLKNAGVDFVDLGETELEHFPGKLAILGPFASKAQIPDGLTDRIKMLAKKGVAVLWILPPDADKELQPPFYLVPEGLGVVVVAQTTLVADLPMNPKSQWNLLRLCELALHPRFLTLPDLSS